MPDNSQNYDRLHQGAWTDFTDYGPSCQTRYRIITGLFRKYCERNGEILEVGSSTGGLVKYLIRKIDLNRARCFACDFSSKSVVLTKQKNVNSFQADLTDLGTFPDRQYQTIICSEVLEHIPDYQKALKNMHSLLTTGGKILISVPYSMRYWTRHDKFALHVRRFEKGELENELDTAKFRIKRLFVWGALFYHMYYFFLEKEDPNITSQRTMAKVILSKIVYYLLFLDDLLLFTDKGRRIFIVAEKI